MSRNKTGIYSNSNSPDIRQHDMCGRWIKAPLHSELCLWCLTVTTSVWWWGTVSSQFNTCTCEEEASRTIYTVGCGNLNLSVSTHTVPWVLHFSVEEEEAVVSSNIFSTVHVCRHISRCWWSDLFPDVIHTEVRVQNVEQGLWDLTTFITNSHAIHNTLNQLTLWSKELKWNNTVWCSVHTVISISAYINKPLLVDYNNKQ